MRDVVYEMEVTLEELCHGGAKRVRIWSEAPLSEGGGGARGEKVPRDIEIVLTAGMSTVSEARQPAQFERKKNLRNTQQYGNGCFVLVPDGKGLRVRATGHLHSFLHMYFRRVFRGGGPRSEEWRDAAKASTGGWRRGVSLSCPQWGGWPGDVVLSTAVSCFLHGGFPFFFLFSCPPPWIQHCTPLHRPTARSVATQKDALAPIPRSAAATRFPSPPPGVSFCVGVPPPRTIHVVRFGAVRMLFDKQ